MNILKEKCKEFGIIPRGIIHIGADIETHLRLYQNMGISRMLFIESDPHVYNSIKYISKISPDIVCVNCTLSNINNSEPNTPVTRSLDTMLQEIKHFAQDYNILNINVSKQKDILLGATETLRYIGIIVTGGNEEAHNINSCVYKNFYFEMIHSVNNQEYWISSPIIQVSTLGINGRFANQVFQHMFATQYASQSNLRPEFPTWIGQILFDINDYPITRSLPQLLLENNKPTEPIRNQDVIGWFQYHTSYYALFQYKILNTYKYKTSISSLIDKALAPFISGRTLVAIHLRKGDYGYGDFFIAPIKLYTNWLSTLYKTVKNPVLYIASDDPEIHKEFAEFSPITSKDLNVVFQYATYGIDFYVLQQAEHLAISNSSFSFLASMLSAYPSPSCVRPDPVTESLIQYDPWNSDVLLKTPENYIHTTSTTTPTTPTTPRNLHIGGQTPHPDWEILNLENTKHTDHVGDASNLYKFNDNTFDKIYASHILEHFDFLDIEKILREWYRVLKPSGILYISVPNISVISDLMKKAYTEDQFKLMKMIFGAHIDKNDYHSFGYTKFILLSFLEFSGFKDVKVVKEFNIFQDTSSMKHNKVLISLNVIASK